jgi:hypothetical protein
MLTAEDKYTFILSMAGSYIACWVLGIRDRHQDNMMIKDNRMYVVVLRLRRENRFDFDTDD